MSYTATDRAPTTQTLDLAKFDELLIHIAERSVNDSSFGKTKLNKILYYIDFNAFGYLGRSVTGATYQHRPYGPVPREISLARSRVLRTGAARLSAEFNFGYQQQRLLACRPANTGVFGREELIIINAVIDWLAPLTAREASDLSHREFGYRMTSDGETIPYETVYVSSRQPTAEDHARADEVWRFLFQGGDEPKPMRHTLTDAA